MAVSVSVDNALHSLMTEHHEWLSSPHNTLAACTVSTGGAGSSMYPAKPGVVYPVSKLLHTVLARRHSQATPTGKRRTKRPALLLTTYSSYVAPDGQIRLNKLLSSYDLMKGIHYEQDAGLAPDKLPAYKKWLMGAAVTLIRSVLDAHNGEAPIGHTLRATDFFVPVHPDPRRIVVDSNPCVALSMEVANKYRGTPLPDTVCPFDGVIVDLAADVDQQDRRTCVLIAINPCDPNDPNPSTEMGDDTLILALPGCAVPDPVLTKGVRVAKGAILASPVPERQYTSWKSLKTALQSDTYIRWFQQQAVQACDGDRFPGLRQAEFQNAVSNHADPVYEALRPNYKVATVADVTYNHNTLIGSSSDSVAVDLWSLSPDN